MSKLTSLLPAELLHQRLVIEGRPHLPDFALRDLKCVDAWHRDLRPAWGNPPKFSLVGTVHRGETGNFVSIGDHDLNRELDREGISQHARELDEAHWAVDTSGGTIEDEIGRQDLVRRRHVSLGKDLVKETTDECAIFFYWHGRFSFLLFSSSREEVCY
jgi:hypothetical protein